MTIATIERPDYLDSDVRVTITEDDTPTLFMEALFGDDTSWKNSFALSELKRAQQVERSKRLAAAEKLYAPAKVVLAEYAIVESITDAWLQRQDDEVEKMLREFDAEEPSLSYRFLRALLRGVKRLASLVHH